MAPAEGLGGCPRRDSPPSDGAGSLFFEVRRQLAIRITTMGDAILLLGRHLGERFRRAPRLKPRVPSELLLASRLYQHFTRALAEEHVTFPAVPICDTALRLSRAIVERVCGRGETLPAGRLEQRTHVRSRKVAELV